MPRRYVRRKTTTKKRYRKNYRKKNSTMSTKNNFKANALAVTYMTNGQNPFPRRYRTKLHSNFYGFIASGSATGRYYVQLNSVFIPWGGGGWPNPSTPLTTTTPAGYDLLLNGQLYNQCRVFGCKLLVEFLPQALTDTVQCTVTPSLSASVPTSVATALPQPYTKSLLMSSSKMNSRNGSAISHYMSVAKLIGVKPQALEYDLSGQYTHAYNGDPATPLYFVVNWATPDAVNLATNLEYRVKATWYIECWNSSAPILPVD